jgi:hypothetical protein
MGGAMVKPAVHIPGCGCLCYACRVRFYTWLRDWYDLIAARAGSDTDTARLEDRAWELDRLLAAIKRDEARVPDGRACGATT